MQTSRLWLVCIVVMSHGREQQPSGLQAPKSSIPLIGIERLFGYIATQMTRL
jgi:hypothetical protein